MMRGVDALAEHLGTVPVLIACCLDHRQLGPIAAPDGTLRAPCAAYASIFPAVQNLLLAARALGLGTTLTTLHRGFEDDLAAALAIPAQVEVVALVPLGYPADRFGPTRRKPVDAIAFLDGWGRPLPPR
jgi:nitroreductase